MGQAIAVRTDYTATEVRLLAKQAKDAAQARRLLAIAAVLDGSSRTEAATNAGMDRQTLRDWVIRFNEQGPDGLVNIPSPGAPPKLNDTHKAFLAGIVHEGPIPAIHGRPSSIPRKTSGSSCATIGCQTSNPSTMTTLLCLEYADRPTLEDHVHCSARLGNRASGVVRIGISPLTQLGTQPDDQEPGDTNSSSHTSRYV